jgi:hypothetical protein
MGRSRVPYHFVLESNRRSSGLLPAFRNVGPTETYQIGIPGATAKDRENRRIRFNPKGRLAAILQRRAMLGSEAYVFGTENGAYQENIQTAWETLRLLAHRIEPKLIGSVSLTAW